MRWMGSSIGRVCVAYGVAVVAGCCGDRSIDLSPFPSHDGPRVYRDEHFPQPIEHARFFTEHAHPTDDATRFRIVHGTPYQAGYGPWRDHAGPGLYRTDDAGATWRRLDPEAAGARHVGDLFVLPVTGELFVISSMPRMEIGDDGRFKHYSRDYVLRSRDGGATWRNITGTGFVRITGMIIDPEHPDRVALHTEGVRSYLSRSVDAEYSKWDTQIN